MYVYIYPANLVRVSFFARPYLCLAGPLPPPPAGPLPLPFALPCLLQLPQLPRQRARVCKYRVYRVYGMCLCVRVFVSVYVCIYLRIISDPSPRVSSYITISYTSTQPTSRFGFNINPQLFPAPILSTVTHPMPASASFPTNKQSPFLSLSTSFHPFPSFLPFFPGKFFLHPSIHLFIHPSESLNPATALSRDSNPQSWKNQSLKPGPKPKETKPTYIAAT